MKSTKSPSIDINSTGLHSSCREDQKLPPQGNQTTLQMPNTFNDVAESRPSKKPKTQQSSTKSFIAASSSSICTRPLQSLQTKVPTSALISPIATNGVAASASSAVVVAPAVAPCSPDLSAAYTTSPAAGLPFHQPHGQSVYHIHATSIPNPSRSNVLPLSSSTQHHAGSFVAQFNVEEALLIERLKLQHYRNLLLERAKQEEERRNQVLAAQSNPSSGPVSIAGGSYTAMPHNMGGTGAASRGLHLSLSALRFVANDFKLSTCNPTTRNQMLESAAPQAGALEPLPRCLLLPIDERKISKYQCLLRKHIEAFEASQDDIDSHSRGRSRKVVVGQVGIRCRHCQGRLAKGSIYFPGTLNGIYQSAQNMALHHINPRDEASRCNAMPAEDISEFQTLLSCKSNIGGGKDYWSEAANMIGLVDTPNGIRFIGRQPVSKAA